MDAISGLLVTLGVSLALVDSTGRQLPLQKLLPRVLAASVLLLRVVVCQNDFQVVPAIAALNCSNITDFLEDSSAYFQWSNNTFTCDLTCVMAMSETAVLPAPSTTSPLYSALETLPFSMTVDYRGEADVDCGMSCWTSWTSSIEPTASLLHLVDDIVGSTHSISAMPPSTEGTSKLLPLMPTYAASPGYSPFSGIAATDSVAQSYSSPNLKQSPTSDSEGEHVENTLTALETTPSPTTPPTPPLDQLKKAAVVATFANIDLEEWEAVESDFKMAVTEQASQYCSQNRAKCAAPLRKRREVERIFQFDPEEVIVLPGYPRVVQEGLQIAFTLSLPHLAEEPGSLLDAAVLQEITSKGKDYIEQHVGTELLSLSQFYPPTNATPPKNLTVNTIAIGTSAFAGCCTVVGFVILFVLMKRWFKNSQRRKAAMSAGTEFTDVATAPSPERHLESDITAL